MLSPGGALEGELFISAQLLTGKLFVQFDPKIGCIAIYMVR